MGYIDKLFYHSYFPDINETRIAKWIRLLIFCLRKLILFICKINFMSIEPERIFLENNII